MEGMIKTATWSLIVKLDVNTLNGRCHQNYHALFYRANHNLKSNMRSKLSSNLLQCRSKFEMENVIKTTKEQITIWNERFDRNNHLIDDGEDQNSKWCNREIQLKAWTDFSRNGPMNCYIYLRLTYIHSNRQGIKEISHYK